MKSAAEKAKHAGEAPVMPFDTRISTLNEYQLTVCPDNVLALVEALELKEEQRAQPCEHSMFWDASGVKRCSKCDLPEHANVHYADAAEIEIAALRQRIAELESRTVKLPERYACELGYNAPDPNGDMLDRDDVIAALTDAGIKVEADIVDADVSDRNQPGMVVAVHIDAGDFVKFRGQVYEVKETDFDDHDVTLWFVCGETLKCAAGCQIEVVSAPREAE
nr:hypothetical protein [Klebsiella michiganensis]